MKTASAGPGPHILELQRWTQPGASSWCSLQPSGPGSGSAPSGSSAPASHLLPVCSAKGHVVLPNATSGWCRRGFLPLQAASPPPTPSPDQKQHQSNQNGNVGPEWGPSPLLQETLQTFLLSSPPPSPLKMEASTSNRRKRNSWSQTSGAASGGPGEPSVLGGTLEGLEPAHTHTHTPTCFHLLVDARTRVRCCPGRDRPAGRAVQGKNQNKNPNKQKTKKTKTPK